MGASVSTLHCSQGFMCALGPTRSGLRPPRLGAKQFPFTAGRWSRFTVSVFVSAISLSGSKLQAELRLKYRPEGKQPTFWASKEQPCQQPHATQCFTTS